MPAGRPKGLPKTGGKRPGSKNVRPAVRTLVENALHNAGGVEYLTEQAKANPKAFLSLIGRLMPLQIAGDPTAPLTVQIVKFSQNPE